MEEYEKFKAALRELCERGKICKDVKKAFIFKDGDVGTLVCRAAEETAKLFERSEPSSAEYAAVCGAAIDFISAAAKKIGFAHDGAVICAYITLSREFNATGDAKAYGKLKNHAQDYNKSLQNIKHGLPLF